MRDNGYSLTQDEVLHQESPTTLAAITDIVRTLVGVVFSLAWIAFAVFGVSAGAAGSGDNLAAAVITLLGTAFAAFSTLAALFGLVVRYLDLTRRTYTVYNDAVAYTEGFLTRDNAVIPYENIADASTKRTPVDQILGLYDVSISCQGSGSEIQFKRLSRAPELREAVTSLVAKASNESREAARKEREEQDAAEDAIPDEIGKPARKATKRRELVDPDEAWTATLQMNMMRAMIPLLATIPVLPLFLLGAIATAIRVSRTTYTIGPNSMATDYTFIGSSQQEFAYDKVTGVQVSRSFIDRWMNTHTIQIWSIGAPMPLTLAHIEESQVDLPRLLAQCGIPADSPAKGELDQAFSIKAWFLQNAIVLAFLAFAAFATLIAAIAVEGWLVLFVPLLLLLPIPMAVMTMLRVSRQRITLHADHMEARTGVLFKQHIHVRYDNIKKVETVAIPLTDQGTLKVYVAGERIIAQQQNQAQGGAKLPYSLTGQYIVGIHDKVDALDALMLGAIDPEQINGTHDQGDDLLRTFKPAIPNAVIPLAIVGLFFPPLWLFLPIVAWQVAVRRYLVEEDRVVIRGGIVYKSVTAVLFNRIDSLQQNQGALGKMFGNGRVIILTAGSSMPDLVVADVPEYTEVYELIRKHYGKAV